MGVMANQILNVIDESITHPSLNTGINECLNNTACMAVNDNLQ
jgi:hypothetical protein